MVLISEKKTVEIHGGTSTTVNTQCSKRILDEISRGISSAGKEKISGEMKYPKEYLEEV